MMWCHSGFLMQRNGQLVRHQIHLMPVKSPRIEDFSSQLRGLYLSVRQRKQTLYRQNEFLCRWPRDLTQRKGRRRCGRRRGVIARLKAYMRADSHRGVDFKTWNAVPSRFAVYWLPDSSSRWLRPVDPGLPDPPIWPRQYSSPRINLRPYRQGGISSVNLRPLSKTPVLRNIIETTSPPKMAMINACSIVNKTFILCDFISIHKLDFLFITETWTKLGDLSPFTELVPADYSFYNSPRPSGRGGGLAVIMKKTIRPRCRLLPTTVFNSFEVQLLQLDWSGPVAIATIYRPPHLTKDFLNEFVGDLITKFDRILLLGDFNIHVCCLSKPLSKEFLDIIDSFNLLQWSKHPTHIHGHILDLVLLYGLFITDICVVESLISDHFPVMFHLSLPPLSQKSVPDTKHVRFYSSQFCEDFIRLFNEVCTSMSLESELPDLDADEHFNVLSMAWLDILNRTAPFTGTCLLFPININRFYQYFHKVSSTHYKTCILFV
ncbi:uncharacterized protein [Pseudorasbora parva]|uniref:uncharacterized protein n=1 Tax=Pseudorasbora parva TaxID=51549 RepID=UPI00351E9C32